MPDVGIGHMRNSTGCSKAQCRFRLSLWVKPVLGMAGAGRLNVSGH